MERADVVRHHLDTAKRLRASGPRTDEFVRWRDSAVETLSGMLGVDHRLTRQLRAAVGPFDNVESDGLQIGGPDGMQARLGEAEPILRQVLGE
ncbi:MAG TPA: hypothetical protein QGF05_06540 [Dehalococcoidia bacterium]|nr:hypothetical protein [Dehalococcoidia bacterium]